MHHWAYQHADYDEDEEIWRYLGSEQDLYEQLVEMNVWNVTVDDFRRIKAMGANLLRLQLPHYYFEPIGDPGAWRSDAFDQLAQWVEEAGEAGLYLLVDLHVPYGGRQYANDPAVVEGDTLWSGSAQQQYVKDWWRAIAERLHNADHVLFELMNEPWPEQRGQSNQAWWQFAQALIDTIRATSATQIIVVPFTLGADEGDPLPNSPLRDPLDRLAYDFHFYKPYAFTHQQAPWVSEPDPAADYPYAELIYHAYSYDASDSATFTGSSTWYRDWYEVLSGDDLNREGVTHIAPAYGSYHNQESLLYDNVEVVIDGEASALFNPGFEDVNGEFVAGWQQWNDDTQTTTSVSWEEVSDNKVVRIEPTPGTSRNISPKAAHLLALPSDYTQIKIQADVMGGNTARTKLFGINWYRQQVYTKDKMSTDLDPYLAFARKHQVPLMNLEFGVIMQATEEQGHLLWLKDWMQILQSQGIHGAYHSYRGYADDADARAFGVYQCWGSVATGCTNQFGFVLPVLSDYFKGREGFCHACLPSRSGWRATLQSCSPRVEERCSRSGRL